jgi:hypothetical protein
MEMIVTLLILGLIAYSFSNMHAHLLSASTEEDILYQATQLAESKLEDAITTGVSVLSQGWTASSPFEWRRIVTTLKPSAGDPTLVEVKVQVRKGNKVICSLVTHIAG